MDPSSGKIDNIYPEDAILSDDTIPSSEISTNLPSSQPGSSQTTSVTLLNSSPSSDTLPFPTYPQISSKVFNALISLSTGDARTALSLLSLALSAPPDTPTSSLIESLRTSVINGYDRTGDAHYDLISALHKSVRGSAGSAALYWLARMLKAGEDPLYIARRMVVCASEDIGLADSQALPLVGFLFLFLFVVVHSLSVFLIFFGQFLYQGNGHISSLSGHRNARVPNSSGSSRIIPL